MEGRGLLAEQARFSSIVVNLLVACCTLNLQPKAYTEIKKQPFLISIKRLLPKRG